MPATPGRTPQAATASDIAQSLTNIPKIFEQAQLSISNHRKNFVALYKIHGHAARCTDRVLNGGAVRLRLTGEKMFEEVFQGLLLRVLPIKKGVVQADKSVKFIGGYTRFVNEKAAEDKVADGAEHDDDEDTTASRFTAHLLKFLVRGFTAKDKNVRYRVLQTVAEMVAHLGEMDEDIYNTLKDSLLDRTTDKEANVRVQAVIAVSKLCGTEDASEEESGETVLDNLVDILAHDPSPEVRRAALINIPITQSTLPHILDRTRDTDTLNRKLVYHSILEKNMVQGEAPIRVLGPTHPRALSISQRELIVSHGLGDREPTVRVAAGSLIAKWAEVANFSDDSGVEQEETTNGVIALLHLFDLAQTNVAVDALLSVFTTRVDIFDNIEFGDKYWSNLTPETAFLARVFVEHCKATKDEVRLEVALPVVTALAFRVQETYNDYLEDLEKEEEQSLLEGMDEEERGRRDDERVEKLFIIGEMLKLAVNLDYADEIGRRKMFQLVRDMLTRDALPQSLIPSCLDVLRTLSVSERDLIRVIVEVVHELRDPTEDEEALDDADEDTTFSGTPAATKPARMPLFEKRQQELKNMTPEEKIHADEIDMRCLTLCIGMLERVNSTFEENVTLEGILKELIVPSFRRNELAFREKGLVCLGLCCLIARRLALQSLRLFISQVESNPPEGLKLSMIKVIFDILMVHEAAFAKEGNVLSETTGALMNRFGTDIDEPKVMALLSIGISKLLLSGLITEKEAVQNLVMVYLDPSTADNQELRQCLTFFFPAYSHSSLSNQRSVKEIFIDAFIALSQTREDLEGNQEMVNSVQVGSMFLDWTDPMKLAHAVEARGGGDPGAQSIDETLHLDMAKDIIKALLAKEKIVNKEDRKALFQLLGKLHIPEKVSDDNQLRTLKLYMDHLRSCRPPRDLSSSKAFTKFVATFCERFEKQLENLDEQEYRKSGEFQEMFAFLDSIVPDEDDEETEIPMRKKMSRKRSNSVTSASTGSTRTMSPSPSKREKIKNKKQRLAMPDDFDDTVDHTPRPAPTRSLPVRSAALKAKATRIAISSDEDDDESENDRTPGPSIRKNKNRVASSSPVKTEDDEETSQIDGPDENAEMISNSHDSIMGSDEDEDEVNDLLADDD